MYFLGDEKDEYKIHEGGDDDRESVFVPMNDNGAGLHAPSVGVRAAEECSVALRSSPDSVSDTLNVQRAAPAEAIEFPAVERAVPGTTPEG